MCTAFAGEEEAKYVEHKKNVKRVLFVLDSSFSDTYVLRNLLERSIKYTSAALEATKTSDKNGGIVANGNLCKVYAQANLLSYNIGFKMDIGMISSLHAIDIAGIVDESVLKILSGIRTDLSFFKKLRDVNMLISCGHGGDDEKTLTLVKDYLNQALANTKQLIGQVCPEIERLKYQSSGVSVYGACQ
jgi:hypothetical protein